MPRAPLTHCQRPGCGLAVERQGACPPECGTPRKRPADTRPSAPRRGYGRLWRKIRMTVLRREPLCRRCAAEGRARPATEVDHVVPLARGGTHAAGNLQPLCKPCHSRKTKREDGPGNGRGYKRIINYNTT